MENKRMRGTDMFFYILACILTCGAAWILKLIIKAAVWEVTDQYPKK